MCRLIALMLMLVLPLQSAWSVAAGTHGHLDGGAAAAGVHAHNPDYHDAGHAGHDLSATADQDNGGHNDDGHHDSHCHHVLCVILTATAPALDLPRSDAAVAHLPPAFPSHIPSLLDRPPSAHA